jgi:hypothetical protein
MTLEEALQSTVADFRSNLQETMLLTLEARARQALAVAENRRGSGLTGVEAWHAGYQLGLMEALQAFEEGSELIAQAALQQFNAAQN